MQTTSPSLLAKLQIPTEERAWARFVDLYSPLLLYWARQTGFGAHDAEDFVQDVFILLVQKLPEFSYDQTRSFRGWLKTVALNKMRDRQRRRSVPVAAGGQVDLANVAGSNNVESFWDGEDQRHLVARALQLMRCEFKEATWRACWELVVSTRSAADVGQELGMSENAVYIAKLRVLRRLREELADLVELQ